MLWRVRDTRMHTRACQAQTREVQRSSGAQSWLEYEVNRLSHSLTEMGPHCYTKSSFKLSVVARINWDLTCTVMVASFILCSRCTSHNASLQDWACLGKSLSLSQIVCNLLRLGRMRTTTMDRHMSVCVGQNIDGCSLPHAWAHMGLQTKMPTMCWLSW